jgi:hypothetical protein
MGENLWAKSADPKKRAAAAKRHQKGQDEREMRTSNVVRQSAWDKLTGKDGKMGKR